MTLPTHKKCPSCLKRLGRRDFYICKREDGTLRLNNYCKQCTANRTALRMQQFKRQCIEYKGGQCEDCGFVGYAGVYDLHHLDPKKKDMSLSRIKSRTFDSRVKRELDKCALLCANCHRIRHGKLNGSIV